jgi:hypothetical protein
MTTQLQTNKEKSILAILSVYSMLTIESVEQLINLTNGIKGVSFVSLKGYSSDKSEGTETANHLVNIGASYANMLTKDTNIYADFDVNTIDLDAFNYATIDTNGLTLADYKKQVKEALTVALTELQAPKKAKDTSNDIWLNKALVFNLNTMRLSIFGQGMTKTVTEKGEFKVVKSAPKTIAKKLIEMQANEGKGGKSQMLRRFALDNFNGTINVSGDTVELY